MQREVEWFCLALCWIAALKSLGACATAVALYIAVWTRDEIEAAWQLQSKKGNDVSESGKHEEGEASLSSFMQGSSSVQQAAVSSSSSSWSSSFSQCLSRLGVAWRYARISCIQFVYNRVFSKRSIRICVGAITVASLLMTLDVLQQRLVESICPCYSTPLAQPVSVSPASAALRDAVFIHAHEASGVEGGPAVTEKDSIRDSTCEFFVKSLSCLAAVVVCGWYISRYAIRQAQRLQSKRAGRLRAAWVSGGHTAPATHSGLSLRHMFKHGIDSSSSASFLSPEDKVSTDRNRKRVVEKLKTAASSSPLYAEGQASSSSSSPSPSSGELTQRVGDALWGLGALQDAVRQISEDELARSPLVPDLHHTTITVSCIGAALALVSPLCQRALFAFFNVPYRPFPGT